MFDSLCLHHDQFCCTDYKRVYLKKKHNDL